MKFEDANPQAYPKRFKVTDLTSEKQSNSRKQFTVYTDPITGTSIGTLSSARPTTTDINPKTCSSLIGGHLVSNHPINRIPSIMSKAKRKMVLNKPVTMEISKRTIIKDDIEGQGCHALAQRNAVFARALYGRQLLATGLGLPSVRKILSNDKISELYTLTFKGKEYSENDAKIEASRFINRFIEYCETHYPDECLDQITFTGVLEQHLEGGWHIHFEIFNTFLSQNRSHAIRIVKANWNKGISYVGEAHLTSYQIDLQRGANYFSKDDELVDLDTGELETFKKHTHSIIQSPAVEQLARLCANRYYLPIDEFLNDSIIKIFGYETKQKPDQFQVTELKGGAYQSYKLFCSNIQDYTPNFAQPRNNFITTRTAAARRKIKRLNDKNYRRYVKECALALTSGIIYLKELLLARSGKMTQKSPGISRSIYVDPPDPLNTHYDTLDPEIEYVFT